MSYDTIERCLNEVVNEYNTYFQKQLKTFSTTFSKSNCKHFSFIPANNVSNLAKTLAMIREYIKAPSAKFLDCGCGIGNVMLIAKSLGFDAYGIEYDEEIYKTALELTQNRYNNIKQVIHGDVTTFGHYANYDVLYFFSPINDKEKKCKFIEKLSNDTKVGGIIYSYSPPVDFSRDVRFKAISETQSVWQKVSE